MKNFFYLLSLAFILLAYSCSQKIDKVQIDDELSVSYFLDGNQIDESTYLKIYETHHNIWIIDELDDNSNPIYENQCFTSDEKYIAWGESQNLNIKDRLAAVDYLRQQAIDLGWVDKYKSLEEVPQEILDDQMSYLEEKNLISSEPQVRTVNQLRDFCYFHSPSIYMVNMLPVMPVGWNNRVTAVMPSGWGFMTVYDRSFFRNPFSSIFLGVAVESCWMNGVYPHPLDILNNRMSSVIAM